VRGVGLPLRHQVAIGKAVVVVWDLLLDRRVQLVKLRTHVSIGSPAAHVRIEDVPTLSGCPWLSVGHELVVLATLLYF